MGKKKTSEKHKKLPKKFTQINGVKLYNHNPHLAFKNHRLVKKALTEALIEGDRETFTEILGGYVRSHNILEVCKRTQLSRTVVYEAISSTGNPSLETLCKIMVSFKQAA